MLVIVNFPFPRIDPNSPVLLEDPVLKEIAEKLGKTTAQLAMRYLLQRGVVVLAKSYTPARIKQNLQVREGWVLLKIKGASTYKFVSFVVCCFTIGRHTFKAEFNMLTFYIPTLILNKTFVLRLHTLYYTL